MTRLPQILTLALFLSSLGLAISAPVVLEDFENLAAWQHSGKSASFKAADSAAVGTGAIQVSLPGTVFKQLSSRPLEGSLAWDQSAGLSFMVKGDGSDLFGCLAVGDRPSGAYSYVYYFPLKNTEWHKITIAWSDLIPEGQYDPIGTAGALPPSGIKALRFGSRWSIYFNNEKIPAHSYSIDQIQIESQVKKTNIPLKAHPFSKVLELLKNKQAIHIVCIGDSITAGTGLANKDSQRYATLTQNILREWLNYDDIVVESRAVGGAKSTDGRAWVARDLVGDAPDLVTLMYGYNDKSGTYTKDYFKNSMADHIKRIIQQTQGHTAILPFATTPGTGPRFVMMDDYAQAIRELAAEQNLAVFDLNQIIKKIGRDKIENFFGDQAHPNAQGHQIIANELANFLVKSAGITIPKPKTKEKPKAKPGQTYTWSFEDASSDWDLSEEAVSISSEKGKLGKKSLKYQMHKPGKDHRRAYSPAIPVAENQSYQIEAKVFCSAAKKSRIGIYVSAYPNPEATGKGSIQNIKTAANSVGRWETLSGTFTVPAGIHSIKILIWSSSDSIGSYFIDDIKVTPVE